MFGITERFLMTRIHKRELRRENERLRINVREVMAGHNAGQFFAIPSQASRKDRDLVAVCNSLVGSEMYGLKDCLPKIKGIPVQIINSIAV